MHRIDVPSAVAALPTPAVIGVPGFFTKGDPINATQATIVDQDWANAYQEELCAVVEASGIVLDKTNRAQLLAALRKTATPVVGSVRGLVGSSPGSVKTASWTASELVAITALGGTAYKGAGIALNFNGAVAALGGMDIGVLPSGTDVSIYAIYNPTANAWNVIGCLGSTSNGPIYTGTHMPAGYTASVLIWAGVTAASFLPPFAQRDRCIWLRCPQLINGASSQTAILALSCSTIVPAAAATIGGNMYIASSVSNTIYVAADANSLGGYQVGSTIPTSGVIGSYGPLVMATPQTIWYQIAGATATQIYISVAYYTF